MTSTLCLSAVEPRTGLAFLWPLSRLRGVVTQSTRAIRRRKFRERFCLSLQTHERCHPFTGAVLAGVFTAGAIKQLKSLGFAVAYFPYETVVKAFAKVRIDASFDEATADDDFEDKFRLWDALAPSDRAKVAKELARLNESEIKTFVDVLRDSPAHDQVDTHLSSSRERG